MFYLDGFSQPGTLVNMRRPLLTEPPSWAVAAVAIVLLIVAGIIVFGHRRPARAESDEFKRQLAALELAWVKGKQAGAFLRSKRLARDEANCSRIYRATVASKFQWDNKDFSEAGRLIFNRGCDDEPESTAPADLLPRQPSDL